jgi:hypothetical protein
MRGCVCRNSSSIAGSSPGDDAEFEERSVNDQQRQTHDRNRATGGAGGKAHRQPVGREAEPDTSQV